MSIIALALLFTVACCLVLWIPGSVSAAFVTSVVVSAGLLFHCALAYLIALSMGFYWFALPHLVLLPLAVTAVVIHTKSRGTRAFAASLICVACLLPTWYFAMSRWPGIWDGMAWFVYVGAMSVLGIVIGLPLIYVAHRLYQRNARQIP